MATRHITQLAQKLTQAHDSTSSWPKAAAACNVLTPSGEPNPKLAEMIAAGYIPRRPETRARLGLPAVCPVCDRRMRTPRNIPAWLNQAVRNLQELERAQPVGYTRQGRPVEADTLAGVLFENVITSKR
jgi:hypothetical protein